MVRRLLLFRLKSDAFSSFFLKLPRGGHRQADEDKAKTRTDTDN